MTIGECRPIDVGPVLGPDVARKAGVIWDCLGSELTHESGHSRHPPTESCQIAHGAVSPPEVEVAVGSVEEGWVRWDS